MITRNPDNGVERLLATAVNAPRGDDSYAVPRPVRRLHRGVVPAIAIGLGLALGGGGLAVLQLL